MVLVYFWLVASGILLRLIYLGENNYPRQRTSMSRIDDAVGVGLGIFLASAMAYVLWFQH